MPWLDLGIPLVARIVAAAKGATNPAQAPALPVRRAWPARSFTALNGTSRQACVRDVGRERIAQRKRTGSCDPVLGYGAAAIHIGSTTVSMTWMTPLSAAMSAFTTFALSTVTPPVVPNVNSPPCTVFTLPAVTSLAITLPGTTW